MATYLFIGANVLVWVLLQGLGAPQVLLESLCHYALIPGDLLGYADPGTRIQLSERATCTVDGSGSAITLFTSMFMHGSWLHIIGNLWFLYIFGDNVEDVMGPGRFVAFYLLSGLGAAAAQIVVNPDSLIPMVGASGAIVVVMGAYARLYPKARLHMLVILGFFVTTISVPALFTLGYWFLLQVLSGLPALGDEVGGVAFFAHIGGFLTGLLLSFVFVRGDLLEERFARPRRRAQREWF